MDVTKSFASAADRADKLMTVVDILATLDGEDEQLRFLAEAHALAKRASRSKAPAAEPRTATQPAMPLFPDVPPASQATSSARNKAAGPTEKIWNILREQPGLDMHEVAKLVYGRSDKQAYDNARSLIDGLQSQNRLKRIGRGKYAVVTAGDGGES